MTSKLTTQTVRTHHPNKSTFEYGGVSAKGGWGKVKCTTPKPGDLWINGMFTDDVVLTKNYVCDQANIQISQDCSLNELSDVDWISKVIAYQELICNEKAANLSDISSEKDDAIKEEQDVDIVSTLSAVAALLRDWCVLEAELSPAVASKAFESSINLDNGHCNESLWSNGSIDHSKMSQYAPLQEVEFNGTNINIEWDGVIQECGFVLKETNCGNSLSSDSADGTDSLLRFQEVVDFGQCSREEAMDEPHAMESTIKPDIFIENQYLGISPTICKDLKFVEHSFVEAEFAADAYHLPNEHFTASRYSFWYGGGDSSWRSEVGDTFSMSPALSEALKTYDRYGKGQILADANEGGNVADFGTREETVSSLHKTQSIVNRIGEGLERASSSKFDAKNETNFDPYVVELMHEAIPFVLPYICLQDLLSMEKVCKPIRDWIKNDVYLWQQLHVEPPLSKSLTDGALLELASRAKGQLRCLDLVDCTKITETTVEQIVTSNPMITKLSLPGCSRISADGIVRMTECLAEKGLPGLKQLRVRNIYGLTKYHLAKLESLVGGRSSCQRKPQYYHNGHHASFCDDERPIDVEVCPKCTNVRLVYDCTREKCQQQEGSKYPNCRACFLCTVRCEECGRCINDNDFEETFSLDILCSCCWLRLPKCATCSGTSCGRHTGHFTMTPQSTSFRGEGSVSSADFPIQGLHSC